MRVVTLQLGGGYMQLELSKKEFRRLLDMVYIGNWILNSTRGDDRFADYDQVESKLFALCRENGMASLVERWNGEDVPSRAFPTAASTRRLQITKTRSSMKFLPRSWRDAIWTISRFPTKTMMRWSPGWTIISPSSKPTAPTISPFPRWTTEKWQT